MTSQKFVPVFFARSFAEADLVRTLIADAGILARIRDEHTGRAAPGAVGRIIGEEVIVVPEEDLGRARRVLEEARESGRELEGYLAEHPGETIDGAPSTE